MAAASCLGTRAIPRLITWTAGADGIWRSPLLLGPFRLARDASQGSIPAQVRTRILSSGPDGIQILNNDLRPDPDVAAPPPRPRAAKPPVEPRPLLRDKLAPPLVLGAAGLFFPAFPG